LTNITTPSGYEAWYHSARGRWIGDSEFFLMQKLLQPEPKASLLDVGCGTGYFSRRFQQLEMTVTGIDPDKDAIKFARSQGIGIHYLKGTAETLPFDDHSVDYSSAITSLCFIENPQKALAEMWRVTRKSLVLGLLNRNSLLYRSMHGRGNYRGALGFCT
jgi:ubiquinone/menaquinone biosynthesis C-methylase UbiE